MKIINKLLDEKSFVSYLKKKKFTRKIDRIVLHHTSDSVENWKKQEKSILYYKEKYEEMGWEHGPHLFVAPEGIYLFTDMDIEGIHANKGNKNSIGIEMVGCYDEKFPSKNIWDKTETVILALLEKFDLELKDIHLHRKYNSKKSCPGKAVTLKKIKEKLKNSKNKL